VTTPPEVRWAILGTANIARAQFLPGLAEAGGGRAVLVAGRDGARAEAWAAQHGVDAGVAGYEAAIGSPDVDAVYIALPNALHAEWTTSALAAGKAVLCEKPLCVDTATTASVLGAAATSPGPLWEAFVFPFQAQHARLTELLSAGAIGEVREIVGSFHFPLSRSGDIRLDADLGGGAIADVGCYPVRLAQELFGPPPEPVTAVALGAGDGTVETDVSAVVGWGTGRLTLGCGFHRAYDTFTRILGTEGSLHLTNPYHPRPGDTLRLHRPGLDPVTESPTVDARSFTAALRHVHGVLAGDEAPRHLAVTDSLPTATVLDALRAAV
jgi:predicted dehydrogenase